VVWGEKTRFEWAKIFVFIICLKQIFLDTTQSRGHKKYLGGTSPRGSGSVMPWFLSARFIQEAIYVCSEYISVLTFSAFLLVSSDILLVIQCNVLVCEQSHS